MPGLLSFLTVPFNSSAFIPKLTVAPQSIQFPIKTTDGSGRIESLSIQSLVLSRCPSISEEYKPAWWLFSGHLQTAYCVVGDFSTVDLVRYDRTLLRVSDGGTLGLDFTPRKAEMPLPDDTPIVVVLHGLTGGSYEGYVRSVLAVACKPKKEGGLGYRGVVVNFRGCAGVPITSNRLYSAGTTEDIATAIFYLSQRYPKARLVGLGFSLGANVLTRYIAEEKEQCPLASGCVLGCPWDLDKNSEHLESGFFSRNVYSKAMGKNIIRLLHKNLDSFHKLGPSIITPHFPILFSNKPMLLREVDENAVRLIGGPSPPFPFPTARDYYRWASSHKLVGDVRTPLLVINADDDPIVMDIPTDTNGQGYTAIVITHGGGHLGWFESSGSSWSQVDRWVRKPVIEWLKATAEDLVITSPPNLRGVEVVDGFTREVGREQIAYKVIDSNAKIDSAYSVGSGLLAGL